MKTIKECKNYLDGFCLKNIGDARVWDCTCEDRKIRIKQNELDCPFPKPGRDYNA
jgi:hypothetical protein